VRRRTLPARLLPQNNSRRLSRLQRKSTPVLFILVMHFFFARRNKKAQ
jgi:hypothetical protein